MSLTTNLQSLVTALGTDYKQFRTWITGSSTGDLTGLTTTAKTSLIAAINEVKASATGAPPGATETQAGVLQVATTAETTAGAIDTDAVTPLKLQQRLTAFAQPLNANLSNLAALAGQTAYGQALLTLANATGLIALLPTSTDTVVGVTRNATQTEVNTGTNDATGVTPLKLQTRLAAFAQPLSANLTALAGVASGVFGRTLLTSADANAAKTSLGLAAVATSGSASDITTGTLPSSVLPALAINDTFVVASQAAMLALTAQRGDIAKRTDLNGQSFVLQADAPTVLANWIALNTTSDVTSVNGQTGVVVLSKTDVGLSNVDNTADTAKPVSTAQAASIATRLAAAANLSDVAAPATALANLNGVSLTALGDPTTDLNAAYTAAKA